MTLTPRNTFDSMAFTFSHIFQTKVWQKLCCYEKPRSTDKILFKMIPSNFSSGPWLPLQIFFGIPPSNGVCSTSQTATVSKKPSPRAWNSSDTTIHSYTSSAFCSLQAFKTNNHRQHKVLWVEFFFVLVGKNIVSEINIRGTRRFLSDPTSHWSY